MRWKRALWRNMRVILWRNMKTVDKLIIPGWLIPVVPEGRVLENHALGISADRIAGIWPAAELGEVEAGEIIELPGHALLPGLINCHGHAAMSLLRGYAEDQPLKAWLEQSVWPLESALVSEDFVRDGVNLAMVEMIRAGITCYSDMYHFPNITAECCLQAGLRCQLTFPIFDFPGAWGSGAQDYINKGLALRDDYKHSELLRVVFGPHAPYTVARPVLEKIATLASELDIPVHIHLHETAQEVADEVAATGSRPLHTLFKLGLLGPRTQCVHMTELNGEDIALLANSGAHVVHCPNSNMKLASGICPVVELQSAGVNVALGTDSAASNNNLNMLGEMRGAGMLAKLSGRNAAALPASRLLSMATINGARAMGREADLGSLETGKLADLIALDLTTPECRPLYQPISQLIYAGNASQVTHSWVAGRTLMSQRQLQTLNVEQVSVQADSWQARISQFRADA